LRGDRPSGLGQAWFGCSAARGICQLLPDSFGRLLGDSFRRASARRTVGDGLRRTVFRKVGDGVRRTVFDERDSADRDSLGCTGTVPPGQTEAATARAGIASNGRPWGCRREWKICWFRRSTSIGPNDDKRKQPLRGRGLRTMGDLGGVGGNGGFAGLGEALRSDQTTTRLVLTSVQPSPDGDSLS